jgi:GT2 family glycosyltransferase
MRVAGAVRVSFVLATFNRRDVLLNTLAEINHCGLHPDEYEIHLVENNSTDGTIEAVTAAMKTTLADGCIITVHSSKENLGACAKNIALPHVRGDYIVLLDDDSFPEPDSVARMIRHFENHPNVGAATFIVSLPNGVNECSAYPNVCIGCGVGLRRETIEQVGGLPEDFFMQAEEYDLSLRLLNAGWEVETFDDLHVRHLKTPVARSSDRTMRLDVRNNLMLIARYFPAKYAVPYCMSWMTRYWLIASKNGRRISFIRGLIAGSFRATQNKRRPVSASAFERFSRIDEIEQSMRRARREYRLRSILLVDVGKNILAYQRAAHACGLRIVGIADPRLAGKRFGGVCVISDETARRLAFDGVVISNSSPIHAAMRAGEWRKMDPRPVIDLLGDRNEARVVAA